MAKVQAKIVLGGGELILETGHLAGLANAAVLARCGGTVVLAAVVMAGARDDLDYFPLSVEYVEKLYAGGRIKGSRWVKREGRPLDQEILAGRLIDRSIRPLFPEGFKNEVQLVLTVLSVDMENEPETLAAIAASAALHISDIPWNGPLAIIRVGLHDGNFFVNPLSNEKEMSDLDLIVSVGKKGVVMLEGGARQVSDEDFVKAVEFAQKEGEKVIEFLEDFREKAGKPKKSFTNPDAVLVKKIEDLVEDKISGLIDKAEHTEGMDYLSTIVEETKGLVDGASFVLIKDTVNKLFKKKVRKQILTGKRTDGRKPEEIRPLEIEAGVLPRTHGSAIFQRGETQVMTIATLGAPSLKQLIESAEGEASKRYMHHYSMPPYSTGSVGRMTGPGRREIGHGALAEKALLPVIPAEEKFPYAIRLVSEVLSSNGSTSMASTCGSTLALMDAGVPITDPVAGISIGLIADKEKYLLLTDIAGIEDFNGDMDFKVAGTKNGITAVQVDIKLEGLPLAVVKEAIEKAKTARLEILEKMLAVIDKPREAVSQYAPKVAMVKIPVEKIGEIIGPGGKNIRRLMEESGCSIDIEDDGSVSISGLTEESVKGMVERIQASTRQFVAGEEFDGVVKRVEPFGAFVEFLPGKEGLVHVSRMGEGYIKSAVDVLKVGQSVKVKLNEVDAQGRYNLTLISPIIQGVSYDRDKSFHSPYDDSYGKRRPFGGGGSGGGFQRQGGGGFDRRRGGGGRW